MKLTSRNWVSVLETFARVIPATLVCSIVCQLFTLMAEIPCLARLIHQSRPFDTRLQMVYFKLLKCLALFAKLPVL